MHIIDPHIHLFDLEQGEYHWLKTPNPPYWPDKAKIHRNYCVSDLALDKTDLLAGFVHIEAGFDNSDPLREIRWLESTVTTPFRSVACIDLTDTSDNIAQLLLRISQHPSVAGVRHILDEQAAALLSAAQVLHNLKAISQAGLIFECQLFATDQAAIDALCQLSQALPSLKIVLNHGAFPPLRSANYPQWLANISKLNNLPAVFVKLSGWEMFDRDFKHRDIAQVTADVMASFNHQHIMFASNFPLCTFSSDYQTLWQHYQSLALTVDQLEQFCYRNAQRIYQF